MWELIVLFLTFVLIANYLIEKLEVDNLPSKPVVITGCDRGFGQLLALELLRKNIPVFAGCLTEDGISELEEQAEGLKGRLWTFQLDVRSQESTKEAARFVESRVGSKGIWGLVNNAGVLGIVAPDDWTHPADYEKVVDVNSFGVVRVTHAFKPLVKRQKGRIVIISSVAGRFPFVHTGPYVMSKYAVEGYADVIRNELRVFGVTVHLLEPGSFATQLTRPHVVAGMIEEAWLRADEETKEEYGEHCKTALQNIGNVWLSDFSSTKFEDVVNAYVHALLAKYPRKRYWVGLDSKFIVPAGMLPTVVVDWLIALKCKLIRVGVPATIQNERKGYTATASNRNKHHRKTFSTG